MYGGIEAGGGEQGGLTSKHDAEGEVRRRELARSEGGEGGSALVEREDALEEENNFGILWSATHQMLSNKKDSPVANSSSVIPMLERAA